MLTLKNLLGGKRASYAPVIQPVGVSDYWESEAVTGTEYILRLRTNTTMTGAAVTADYRIPMHHLIKEVTAYHYTAAGAAGTDPLTFSWYIRDGANWRLMFQELNVAYSSFNVNYMDESGGGRRMNPTQYRFVMTSTATDLIAISLRVEVISA